MTSTETAPGTLKRFSRDAELDDMLAAYRTDGGFVIERLFDQGTIDAMRAASDRRADEIVPGSATQGMGEDGKTFVGANTVRFSSLGTLTPAYFDMLDNEIYAALADAILLPACGEYWVNTGQVMYIGPGEKAQVLHRDANNWWEYVRGTWPKSADITLSAMIGLESVTEELGATRVVPGSHTWAELNRFETEQPELLAEVANHRPDIESVPAELEPGDAFIYSGYVLHGGGENRTSEQWRRAMHLSFVAGWLTPEESCALDFTDEELTQRSPRVRRLLGHTSYDARPHPGGGLWLRDVKEF
ncbi:MAG: phytanoyl-CoA dioxygenase family protein [Acidimicrobiales bacterium]